MDFRTTLRNTGESFVALWILIATIGYVVLTSIGHMHFQQYVLFLLLMALVYYFLRYGYVLWMLLGFYVLYLILVRANFIDSPTLTKIDQVLTKAGTDIVQMVKGEIQSPVVESAKK